VRRADTLGHAVAHAAATLVTILAAPAMVAAAAHASTELASMPAAQVQAEASARAAVAMATTLAAQMPEGAAAGALTALASTFPALTPAAAACLIHPRPTPAPPASIGGTGPPGACGASGPALWCPWHQLVAWPAAAAALIVRCSVGCHIVCVASIPTAVWRCRCSWIGS
jgi:hypothetical protein